MRLGRHSRTLVGELDARRNENQRNLWRWLKWGCCSLSQKVDRRSGLQIILSKNRRRRGGFCARADVGFLQLQLNRKARHVRVNRSTIWGKASSFAMISSVHPDGPVSHADPTHIEVEERPLGSTFHMVAFT